MIVSVSLIIYFVKTLRERSGQEVIVLFSTRWEWMGQDLWDRRVVTLRRAWQTAPVQQMDSIYNSVWKLLHAASFHVISPQLSRSQCKETRGSHTTLTVPPESVSFMPTPSHIKTKWEPIDRYIAVECGRLQKYINIFFYSQQIHVSGPFLV